MKTFRICWSYEYDVEAETKAEALQRARDIFVDQGFDVYDLDAMVLDEDPVQIVELDEDGDPIV